MLKNTLIDEKLLTRVEFCTDGFRHHSNFVVEKTTKGVIATHIDNGWEEFSETKLDAAEWQHFVDVLQKCINSRWKKSYYEPVIDGGVYWHLYIFFSDEENNLVFSDSNAYPSNWNEFEEAIDYIETKMVKKPRKSKSYREFVKRQMKLLTRVKFREYESPGSHYSNFVVEKTTKGVIATHIEHIDKGWEEFSETKLDSAEWQRFVDVLQKCINRWEERYYEPAIDGTHRRLCIFFSDKEKLIFFSSNAYPSNWNEFKKAIDYIKTKMVKKPRKSKSYREFFKRQNKFYGEGG